VEMGSRDAVCDTPREEYTRNLVVATPEMPAG